MVEARLVRDVLVQYKNKRGDVLRMRLENGSVTQVRSQECVGKDVSRFSIASFLPTLNNPRESEKCMKLQGREMGPNSLPKAEHVTITSSGI